MRQSRLTLLVLLLLLPLPLQGQVVRGQLLSGENGLPLEGAMVVLVGPSGEVGTVLTNAAGRFLIPAPEPGTYTIRADRIGHASTTSDPLPLSTGDTVDVRMVAEVQAIQLAGLEVAADRRCQVRPESGRAVATVWEEARKALSAAAFTDAGGYYRYRTIRFVRDMDDRGRRVLSEQRRASQGYQAAPFESLPAETLLREGFMRPDPDGDLYFAPDAEVLLSDEFLDTHCLGLTAGRGDTEGLLGVLFEPVAGRDLPEIRGTVWVDPATAELRYLDYTYENLDPALRSDAVGGEVHFQGLPNGTWIVTEWRIRMPTPGMAPDFRGGRQVILAGIREVGGEVDRVQDQSGVTILEAERATLTGVVLDETGLDPLPGASVEILGTTSSASTGPDGSFRLGGLPEGVYSVTFSHPDVLSVPGLPEPREVQLQPGEVASVRLVAPPLSRVLAEACGDSISPESSTVLTGRVTDGETGAPLSGAQVRILWSDFRFRGTQVARGVEGQFRALMSTREDGLEGTADGAGRYLACGVPADHPLRLEAVSGERVSESVALRIPAGAEFFQQDLTVQERGEGVVQGRVVDWQGGGPLEGATVTLQAQGMQAITDGDGRFRFEEVPMGQQVLAAHLLGRASLQDTVRIRPNETLELELRLPTEAMEIEGVTVEVLSQREMDFRREGFSGGRFDRITPEEMEVIRDRVTNVVDVIRSMGSPRIRVTETNAGGIPMGLCIRWTRREISVEAGRQRNAESADRGTQPGCTAMLIVLDGMPMQDVGGAGATIPATEFLLDLTPEEIESVRVLSPTQARFQFGSMGDRGALVIETRRGGGGGGGEGG